MEQPAEQAEADGKVEADDGVEEVTVDEEAASLTQSEEAPEVTVVDRSTPLIPPAVSNATETTPAEEPPADSSNDLVPPANEGTGVMPAAGTGEIELALTELTAISRTPPAFPRVGTRNSLSVEVEFLVDTSGNVRDLQIKDDPPERFKRSVIEAVQTWKFEPYLEAGTPRPVRTFVRITFRN
jgi:TonB family protein